MLGTALFGTKARIRCVEPRAPLPTRSWMWITLLLSICASAAAAPPAPQAVPATPLAPSPQPTAPPPAAAPCLRRRARNFRWPCRPRPPPTAWLAYRSIRWCGGRSIAIRRWPSPSPRSVRSSRAGRAGPLLIAPEPDRQRRLYPARQRSHVGGHGQHAALGDIAANRIGANLTVGLPAGIAGGMGQVGTCARQRRRRAALDRRRAAAGGHRDRPSLSLGGGTEARHRGHRAGPRDRAPHYDYAHQRYLGGSAIRSTKPAPYRNWPVTKLSSRTPSHS